MQDWEIGLIVGCSVVSVVLFAIVIRYLCVARRGTSSEKKPLLGGDKQSSTTAALRIETHIQVDQGQQPMADGAFLDSTAMRRITTWIDEVEKARRSSEGLVPLAPISGADAAAMLGDTPDFSGVITPRTPNSLSPRLSSVDGTAAGSSTSNMYLGYSPKLVQAT